MFLKKKKKKGIKDEVEEKEEIKKNDQMTSAPSWNVHSNILEISVKIIRHTGTYIALRANISLPSHKLDSIKEELADLQGGFVKGTVLSIVVG